MSIYIFQALYCYIKGILQKSQCLYGHGEIQVSIKDYKLVSNMCNVVDREITHVYVWISILLCFTSVLKNVYSYTVNMYLIIMIQYTNFSNIGH